MKRKILLLLIIILLSVACAFAQSGTTGPLTWELNDGTLTISGDGKMPDYDRSGMTPWYEYQYAIFTVVIENGVENIGSNAFSYCTNLTSVIIPNSVKSIGYSAFSNCTVLFSITIPGSVTEIRTYAFSKCTFMNSVTISNGVQSIESGAFGWCSALTSIAIPSSVKEIGSLAFYACTALASIEVDSENQNYASDNGVLLNKEKTALIFCPAGKTGNYVIPNSVTEIWYGAFYYCKNLASITIPNSVINIGERAFYACEKLTSFHIPNGVQRIENSTFAYCLALTSVTIPSSVTSIGYCAFFNCPFTSITIPNSVTTIEGAAFWNCTELTSVTIPNGVTTIGYEAFYNCLSLTSATIPSSVTSIESGAFAYCSALTSITNLNPTPVDISWWTFSYVDLPTCTLNVPASAVAAYQNAAIWEDFYIVGDGFLVNPMANNNYLGYTTGNGLYQANATAIVTATPRDDREFLNWTKDGEVVSTNSTYSFTVTEDTELIAIFWSESGYEDLDFDTYAVIKWSNTIMLNLKQLTADGYEVTACKWYKNGELISEGFTYSAGSKITDQLEADAVYTFELSTRDHGTLYSTDKVIEKQYSVLRAYPNPLPQGSKLTIEGTTQDSLVEVFNINSACVNRTTATGSVTELTLDLPIGIYMVRTHNETIKIIIK